MAIRYKRAPVVEPGQPITSRDYNDLARAINDRLEHGVADPSWRLFWYAHSVFRTIRQGDGRKYPADDEWWSHWSHITPEQGKDWPEIGMDPGLVGGVHPLNPFGSFVFGSENLNIYQESDRINYDPQEKTGIDLIIPGTGSDRDLWELAAKQRGTTDTTGTNISVANAIQAADEYLKINYSSKSPLLKGYGGFFAGPEWLGKCANGDDDNIGLKFTKYTPTPNIVCNYSTCRETGGTGACPGISKPVLGWFAGYYGFVLYHYDDTQTILPYEDYAEGPYSSNPQLRHEKGGQLDFALNSYASNFRGADYGSTSQRREPTWDPTKHSFYFEEFFTRQYYLAPARGDYDGNNNLVAEYPNAVFTSNSPTGTAGLFNGQSSYTVNSSFVFAGALVDNLGTLYKDKTLGIYVNGNLEETVTIEAGTNTSKSIYFKAPYPAGSVIQIKLHDNLYALETVFVEIAELLDFKPRVQDAYVLLRTASSRNLDLDGWGRTEADAKEIWENYERYGMSLNYNRSSIKEVTGQQMWKNPVYEDTRKTIHDRLRMLKRQHLIGYEIDSEGNSQISFRRYPEFEISGVDPDFDMFEGMAPRRDNVTTGTLIPGATYKVIGSGSVLYNNLVYAVNSTFKAVYGQYDWTVISGNPKIREEEILISEAPKQGETNEWQMFLQSLPYKDAASNVYKPDVFADRDGMFIDRCTLLSEDWSSTTDDEAKEIRAHTFQYQAKPVNHQENPPGYRYLLGTNQPSNFYQTGVNDPLVMHYNNGDCSSDPSPDNCDGQVKAYKSCQIYPKDYQVKRVKLLRGASAAQDVIRVTLDGRLRHNEEVANTAVNGGIQSFEDYITADDNTASGLVNARSDENAVVEYLLYHYNGDQCKIRIGDQSADASGVSGWQSNIYHGACFPRFFFTKKMPYVYEDGNDTLDDYDTRLTIDNMLWGAYVIRAICEGYLDADSSTKLAENAVIGEPCKLLSCSVDRLFDYRFRALMLKANDNNWFSLHPDRKPDPQTVSASGNTEGHGPYSQMIAYAEHFNQLARALNNLTRARIELPVLKVKHRVVRYKDVYPAGTCDSPLSSYPSTAGTLVPSTAQDPNPGEWMSDTSSGDCPSPNGNALVLNSQIDASYTTNCEIEVTRWNTEFQIDFDVNGANQVTSYAMNEDLKALVNTQGGSGFQVAELKHSKYIVTSAGSSSDHCAYQDGSNWYSPQVLYTEAATVSNSQDNYVQQCLSASSGTIAADPLAASDIYMVPCGFYSPQSYKAYLFNDIRAFVIVPTY